MESKDKKEIKLPLADDFHLHLRDGKVTGSCLKQMKGIARAIIMPNLKPPVVNTKQALAYRERILSALPKGMDFTPLMTLYMTDKTSPEDIKEAKASGHVYAVKLYPKGVTTNSESGVTDIKNVYPVLKQMVAVGMPLLIHGEVYTPSVDFFDREKVFLEEVMKPLVKAHPKLKIVMEHITTKEAVSFVSSCGANVAATITPHHLLYNRNAIFNKGLCPHFFCLPILKREEHRKALVSAATSGNPKFFAGTDSAPHPKSKKESACGCAGCYVGFASIELYAETFAQQDALSKLEAFLCLHGAKFYGLTPHTKTAQKLVKKPWKVPEIYELGDDIVVPLRAGGEIKWSLEAL
uniref:Dihydroorotase n=1 Tax=Amorphochlora amoebiformis TaxID=1561963 RepID=A0A7S0H4I3_9EUKA|mmetsp:Transcript_28927/g.46251  ORF Transcript_28927/g.46251 Transcript_28927/m.46251 type:complete len:351 (+) Transcript_28927:1-1053(+)